MDKTNIYQINEFENMLINKVLDEVYEALKERGYNPISQIAGYLISGDPGYISSYQNARNKILEIDRNKIIMTLLQGYLVK